MDELEKRSAIHEAISEAISEADDAMVSGWVLIVEKVIGGVRELELVSSDATSDHALPEWTGRGWLKHVDDEMEWDDDFAPGEEPEDVD